MVQLPGEQSHKTKQNFLTHIITRSQLLRNTKKHPLQKVSGICQIYSGVRNPLFVY